VKSKKILELFVFSLLLASSSSSFSQAQPSVPSLSDLSAIPGLGDQVGQARYAWYLFLTAMAPSVGANGPLTYQNWTEQCQINPAMVGCPTTSAATNTGRTLHGSALLSKQAIANGATIPGIECNGMAQGNVGGYPVPANVTASAIFCEEVFVNPAEAEFITSNTLSTLSGQQTYGSTNGQATTFPWEAIEVKADWVPTSSFSNPTFSCPDTSGQLYTEVINGNCYALVGIHLSSKALPDWLWATFEPASTITNPNRCDPALYDTCFDPWGTTSTTPYSKGQTAQQSMPLAQAMTAAGLNKAFNNYFLTGVQTLFVNNGQAVPLGNSFVEFNAQVQPGQASCITCHRYAYFDGNIPEAGKPEDNFGGPPTGWPSVGYACNQNQRGNCTPLTPNSTSQDFSWMLGLLPFGP
jgi:hypothetical protein